MLTRCQYYTATASVTGRPHPCNGSVKMMVAGLIERRPVFYAAHYRKLFCIANKLFGVLNFKIGQSIGYIYNDPLITGFSRQISLPATTLLNLKHKLMPSNKPAAKLRLNRKTIIHLRNIAQLNGGQDTTTIPETGTISGGMTTCAGIPTATQRPMPGKPH